MIEISPNLICNFNCGRLKVPEELLTGLELKKKLRSSLCNYFQKARRSNLMLIPSVVLILGTVNRPQLILLGF
jgi:hypothetical protein